MLFPRPGHRRLRLALSSGLLLFLLWPAAPARAEAIVRGFYFYSPDCSHCQKVGAEVMPGVEARFGSQLELRKFDIREPANYQVLLALETRYGVKEPGLPEIFVGGDVLVGEDAMRTGLAALVEKHLSAGGTDFPTSDRPVAVAQPTVAATPDAPLVHVAYFFKRGCSACDRASYDLDLLRSRYPNLRVTSFDIAEQAALNEALAERTGLSAEKRLGTPAFFIGDDALIGKDASLANLEALIKRYQQSGARPVWEGLQTGAAQGGIVERFRSFGLLTVIGAALIDGLNPCAFATIIFFISYLAFLGRSRRDIILVGAAFTLGVFATYLLVGLGVLRFVQALSGIRAIGRIIYGGMAALSLAFAGVSLYDAWQARKGRPEAMRMRLPRALQKRVHQVIREHSSTSASAGVAAVTGMIVSLIELACTGQVYLPTILFVLGVPQMRLQAASYLVLYNLVFVVPLVVVFIVAALGVNSGRLAGLMQRHTGTIKLLTAVVFALLGLWLLSVVL